MLRELSHYGEFRFTIHFILIYTCLNPLHIPFPKRALFLDVAGLYDALGCHRKCKDPVARVPTRKDKLGRYDVRREL
jgi:hypothetical protein